VDFQYPYNIGEDVGDPYSSGNVFEKNDLDIRVENFPVARRFLTIKSNSFNSFWDSNSPGQNQRKNIEVFESQVVI
jgi:hypothetical protein